MRCLSGPCFGPYPPYPTSVHLGSLNRAGWPLAVDRGPVVADQPPLSAVLADRAPCTGHVQRGEGRSQTAVAAPSAARRFPGPESRARSAGTHGTAQQHGTARLCPTPPSFRSRGVGTHRHRPARCGECAGYASCDERGLSRPGKP